MVTESSAHSEALLPLCAFSIECFSFSKLFTYMSEDTLDLLHPRCLLFNPTGLFFSIFSFFWGVGGFHLSRSRPSFPHFPEQGEN